MEYDLKVTDFIDNIKNYSSFELDELVSIAKRDGNTKREFLFVNNYLGKHIPVKGSKALELFKDFYNNIKNKDCIKDKKVLVIGFAETATALGESVVYNWLQDDNKTFEIVSYAQTTRELVNHKDYIAFEEEHSHATTQKLYYKKDLNNFDTILFIEDEITTGNTILNCLPKIKTAFNKESNYIVASILNWQDTNNKEKFIKHKVDSVALITGEIKNQVPSIKINSVSNDDNYSSKINLKNIAKYKNYENVFSGNNIRVQKNIDEMKNYFELINSFKIDKEENIDLSFLGTEEFMFIPILLANKYNAIVRASTRSPIIASLDKKYPIRFRTDFPSRNESERKTYLYNVDKDFDKHIYIFTDSNTEENPIFSHKIENQLYKDIASKIFFVNLKGNNG